MPFSRRDVRGLSYASAGFTRRSPDTAVPVTVLYAGRVSQYVARWKFDQNFADDLQVSDLLGLKINGASAIDSGGGANVGDDFVDLEYDTGYDTDIGDTWLVDGDVSIGGSLVVTDGQTGTVKGLISVTAASDEGSGTVRLVLNGGVTAGVAGTDLGIEMYEGLDWLPALAVSDLDADTPGAGQTTVDMEFL